jgi:hypothetical protein
MAKNPADRFASCEAMAKALEKVLKPSAVKPAPPKADTRKESTADLGTAPSVTTTAPSTTPQDIGRLQVLRAFGLRIVLAIAAVAFVLIIGGLVVANLSGKFDKEVSLTYSLISLVLLIVGIGAYIYIRRRSRNDNLPPNGRKTWISARNIMSIWSVSMIAIGGSGICNPRLYRTPFVMEETIMLSSKDTAFRDLPWSPYQQFVTVSADSNGVFNTCLCVTKDKDQLRKLGRGTDIEGFLIAGAGERILGKQKYTQNAYFYVVIPPREQAVAIIHVPENYAGSRVRLKITSSTD